MQSVAETDNKTDKQIRNAAVGRRIRGARLEKDINQKTLAERVQMDPKYLSRIENGHSGVSRELLLRIGRELGKGLVKILGFSPPPVRALETANPV